MIEYQLAKELKDAGFPQDEDGNLPGYSIHPPWCTGWELGNKCKGKSESVYIPTLSELIEACGEDFASLHKHGVIWDCMPTTGLLESGVGCWSGDTPLEAVARLWLALNKK